MKTTKKSKLIPGILALALIVFFAVMVFGEEKEPTATSSSASWSDSYSSAEEMLAQADVAIVGVLSSSYTEMRGSLVFTRNVMEVVAVYSGDVQVGDTIEVLQTGGTYGDTTTPAFSEVPLLESGQTYALSLTQTEPDEVYGQYYLIMGGPQGLATVEGSVDSFEEVFSNNFYETELEESTAESQQQQEMTDTLPQVVNPIQSDVDVSDFLAMGIPVEAPDGTEDVVYNIIGEEVVEITFTLDHCSYTLRASKTIQGQDLHGVYEPLGEEATGISRDGVNFGWTMMIVSLEQGGQIATNTIHMMDHDTIYLTLVTTEDTIEMEVLVSAVSNQIVDTIIATGETGDWGITLTSTNITPTGLTIVCEQVDGEQQGELQTGSYYWLEVYEGDTWQAVPYLLQEENIGWTSEAWIISLNDTTEWEVDWEWLYGALPSGEYRIAKSVMNFIEAGNYEEQAYYATFSIE